MDEAENDKNDKRDKSRAGCKGSDDLKRQIIFGELKFSRQSGFVAFVVAVI